MDDTTVSSPQLRDLFGESFNVPAVYLAVSPVLSLYSNGMMTGCVIESGEGVTHACGVYEGFALPNGAVRSPINGGSATTYLQELLKMRGLSNHQH